MRASDYGPFNALSVEELMLIFLQLTPEDLARVAAIGGCFYDCSREQTYFWKLKFRQHFPDLISQYENDGVTDWFAAFKQAFMFEYRLVGKKARHLFSLTKENDVNRLSENLTLLKSLKPMVFTHLLRIASRYHHQGVLDLLFTEVCLPRYINSSGQVNCGHVVDQGQTILHWAAMCNQVQHLRRFLDLEGVNIDASDEHRVTPMICAAEYGHNNIVRELVAADADVNLSDEIGFTPLIWAAHNGNEVLVSLLVANHADINACCSEGKSVLAYAADNNHLSIVRALITAGATIHGGLIPAIYLAAYEGHYDVVEFLLDQGANVNNSIDGSTSLHCAISQGHFNVARLLLRRGADVNAEDENGITPIFIAARKSEAFVDLLIQNDANLLHVSEQGYTVMFDAVISGRIELVQKLMRHGLSPNVIADNGITPLYLAVYHGNLNMVTELLKYRVNTNTVITLDDGNDLDEQYYNLTITKSEVTPLFRALQHNHTDIALALIAARANVNTVLSNGKSPLYVAVKKGNLEAVQALISAGANINATKDDGTTPCMLAISGKHFMIAEELIRAGVDVNAYIDDKFTTILHVAAELGMLDIVNFIVSQTNNLHMANSDGKTPLDLAIANGHKEIINLLTANNTVAANDLRADRYLQVMSLFARDFDDEPENMSFIADDERSNEQHSNNDLGCVSKNKKSRHH